MTTAEKEFVRDNVGRLTIEQIGNILVIAALTKVAPNTVLNTFDSKTKEIQEVLRKF